MSPRVQIHRGTDEPDGGPDALQTRLRQVALGDKDAFSQVCSALADSVYGLACRALRDPAQAEEAAQEVLVEI